MSSAIHHSIRTNEGTPIAGYSFVGDDYVKGPGLEALVEEDREVLLELEKVCNTKIEKWEEETCRQFSHFRWNSSFTPVSYEGDDRIALLMFQTVVEASKRLPHLTFEFHDSYYLNVLYQINNGGLVALPEIEIDDELWAWEGLQPEQREPYLEKAKEYFSHLLSLNLEKISLPSPAIRSEDCLYLVHDLSVNPSFVFGGTDPRFLSVIFSNTDDIAKNGKSNFDNLGGDAFSTMRDGLSEVESYLNSLSLIGVGASESPDDVRAEMGKTLDEFERLLNGQVHQDRGNGLLKCRIGLSISYRPKNVPEGGNLQRIAHKDPPRRDLDYQYSAFTHSNLDDVCLNVEEELSAVAEGFEYLTEFPALSSNIVRRVQEILEKNKDLESYAVNLNLYH